jgi:hypothetical protein
MSQEVYDLIKEGERRMVEQEATTDLPVGYLSLPLWFVVETTPDIIDEYYESWDFAHQWKRPAVFISSYRAEKLPDFIKSYALHVTQNYEEAVATAELYSFAMNKKLVL